MSTSPHAPVTTAAFVAVVDEPLPPPHRLLRWQRRVVLAATLFVGVIVAGVSAEAARWHLVVRTGVVLEKHNPHEAHVEPGSLAAAAGAPDGPRLWAIDDDEVRFDTDHLGVGDPPDCRSDAVVIDDDGDVFVRVDAGEARLRFDDDRNDSSCISSTDAVVRASGPIVVVRDPRPSGFALPIAVVAVAVAFVLAMLGSRRPWRLRETAQAERLRRRAALWPAFTLSVVAPIYGHLIMLRLVGFSAADYAFLAVVLTAVPHVLLIRAALHAAHRALLRAPAETPRLGFVIASFVPGAMFLVPPMLCLLIGLPVLALLRNEARHLDD